MSTIDALALRKTLGRANWLPPVPFGPDGWRLLHKREPGSLIVTAADHDGEEWVHASIAFAERHPTYDELVALHWAVWQGRGYAYQVFAPPSAHVNIHEHALHLWGRRDGSAVLPDFGRHGTI